MKSTRWVFGAALLLALACGAQAAEGDRPQRGTFNMEEFRARMNERLKESLGVNDEEFKVLQPKLEAVQKAQSESRGGGFMRRGSRGGPGGPGGTGGDANAAAPATPAPNAPPESDVQKKTQELQTLVQNKDADPAAVKAKLAELREAREKSRANLKKAQEELRELVTPRQEAVLVTMGMLE